MTAASIGSYADIEGWFFWDDRALFDVLLESQAGNGTLVELGAYLGRSAVVIGDHLREGERFVVVDLFGADTDDIANRRENSGSYATLTRSRFEANYLALHDTLPEVVQGRSTEIVEHVEPGSVRFVHVDASHLYAQVAEDIAAIKNVMQPNGIVVFDDYRAEHTPGVAAAVWGATATTGLTPFALTRYKLYATWGDAGTHVDVLRDFLRIENRMGCSEHQILGNPVLLLKAKPKAKPAAAPAPTRRSDWLPPALVDFLRARR